MAVYRFGRWRYGIRPKILRMPFSALYKLMFFHMQGKGIEIPCEAEVGTGFRIDHQGGIVISGYARIGKNCVVRNGVTIGLSRTDDPAAPVIGDNVDIGTGAKLLGRITIGDNVKIGANAVVLTDIPANSTAVGIPAKVISPKNR
jgi:serine O-acetyltransferase